jgi:hypothetical protein
MRQSLDSYIKQKSNETKLGFLHQAEKTKELNQNQKRIKPMKNQKVSKNKTI